METAIYTEDWVQAQMKNCTICPRNCKADRIHNQNGFCSSPAQIFSARAALHFWEEPCISGTKGSGAIFFSGCNLKCVFCQNHNIALAKHGYPVSSEKLRSLFDRLLAQGAHNINLVTPTHYLPQIATAIHAAKKEGFPLPFVYNTGSYESVDSLRYLEGLIDIYLPDFKYVSETLSEKLSHAPNYFSVASVAIAEMFRQVGEPVFDTDELMQKGVIVRHLCLPGQSKDTKKVLRYLYETYHNQIYISIMNQYTPMEHLSETDNVTPVSLYPQLLQRLTPSEYEKILSFATRLGIENGFIQEGETAKESFIPLFDGEGIL